MRKTVTLFVLVVWALSSLLILPLCSAISMPVPEFTLVLVEHPYDTAPTTTIDPYTGKSVTTQAGYHVDNRSIEVVIKNQPFTPYKDSTGNNITLMYNIRWKGHFGNSWGYYAGEATTNDNTRDYVHASSSSDTVVVGGLSWNEESVGYNFFIAVPSEGSQGGQVDFQVKALVGYANRVDAGIMIPLGATYYYNFTGVESDWSNTQTIDINDDAITIAPNASPTATALPSQEPTATPDQSSSQSVISSSLDWMQIATVALLVTIAVLLVFVVVFLRRSSVKPPMPA